jgi:prolyl oligopeptidase
MQHQAVSVDGARIPYFQIARAEMPLDGSNLCLLTGYGGYQIASLPYYSPHVGKLWLERGGVFVIANIRGGGEFSSGMAQGWHGNGQSDAKKV